MNRRFLAVCLFSWAACTLATAVLLAVLAVKGRRPATAVVPPAVLAFAAAVLANSAADLW